MLPSSLTGFSFGHLLVQLLLVGFDIKGSFFPFSPHLQYTQGNLVPQHPSVKREGVLRSTIIQLTHLASVTYV